jgi:hypothetical protein
MANPQLTARVSTEFAARVEALRTTLNKLEANRALPLELTDVVRTALVRGVESLEREHPPAKAKAPARLSRSKVSARSKRGKR